MLSLFNVLDLREHFWKNDEGRGDRREKDNH